MTTLAFVIPENFDLKTPRDWKQDTHQFVQHDLPKICSSC